MVNAEFYEKATDTCNSLSWARLVAYRKWPIKHPGHLFKDKSFWEGACLD